MDKLSAVADNGREFKANVILQNTFAVQMARFYYDAYSLMSYMYKTGPFNNHNDIILIKTVQLVTIILFHYG